MGQEGIE